MSGRILIIEDNRTNLELMSYLLAAHQYQVLSANDGEEGLDLTPRESPDLIICDIHLPAMDGHEVARRLKEHASEKLRSIPLVAVTALAMVGDKEKIIASGFDGYIAKPIVPETFVEEIERFLPRQLRSEPLRFAAADPTEPAVKKASDKRAVLLLVDDSAVELQLLNSLLEPSGYDVITASEMAQAIDYANTFLPDVIVCDVNMPGGSGFDLVKSVKSNPRLSAIPVILITSTVLSDSDRRRGLEAGAMRYLKRPVEPLLLLKEIEITLNEAKERSHGKDSGS